MVSQCECESLNISIWMTSTTIYLELNALFQPAPQLIFLILLMVPFIIILQDIPTINLLKLALISSYFFELYIKKSHQELPIFSIQYILKLSVPLHSHCHHLKLGTSFISRPPLRDPNQCPHGWMIANIPGHDRCLNTGCNSLL